MGGLKKMISKFIKNLKESEYYQNKDLQLGIVITTTVITMMSKLLPGIRENILAVAVGLIIVGGPITILAIYDGIMEDKFNDDDHDHDEL